MSFITANGTQAANKNHNQVCIRLSRERYIHIYRIYSLDARESMAPPILEASTNITATLSFLSPFLISFYYFIYIVYKIEVQKHLETGCRTDRSVVSAHGLAQRSRGDVRMCVCVTAHTRAQPNLTHTRINQSASTRSHIRGQNVATERTNERTKTNKHRTIHNHDQIDSKTVRHRLRTAIPSSSSSSSYFLATLASLLAYIPIRYTYVMPMSLCCW